MAKQKASPARKPLKTQLTKAKPAKGKDGQKPATPATPKASANRASAPKKASAVPPPAIKPTKAVKPSAAPKAEKAAAAKSAPKKGPAEKPVSTKAAPAKAVPPKAVPPKATPAKAKAASIPAASAAKSEPAKAKGTLPKAGPAKTARSISIQKAAPKPPTMPARPVQVAGVLQAARSVASKQTKIVETTRDSKSHLTAEELAEFRQILLDKRRELVEDMVNLEGEATRTGTESGSASSAMPIHMADLGSDTWEQEFTLNLIEQERTIVREIDEALNRIENKTYGTCLGTGKPISKARLRVKPWAKYCIEYARKRELGLS